ncbi:MAG TPA: hypothetical protein DET40_06645 [Lentisphaeria bacterium]|nr:MAG: hypothetical protein A2X45_17480 [Lentisphaerae bacterium GWF2_50_93]HCE43207.1 hypothetical protein [Lentisphaeria bacterium]
MDTKPEKDMPVLKAEPVEIQKAQPQPEFPEIRKAGINLHPMSGLLILFLDYAFFVQEITIIALPFTCILGFVLSFIGIFLIQKYIDNESSGRAVAKAFFGGVVTGIPTPLFGTVFGTLILTVSGLSFLKRR